MNLKYVISQQRPILLLSARFARVAIRLRLARAGGAFLLLVLTLAGCSAPAASAQIYNTSLKSHEPRLVTIESAEVAYLSIANATEKIDLSDWQKAGWKLGNTLGAEDAVPTDCALHIREGADTQVYAACIGPMTVSILPDNADIIYVTLIIGKDDQVRSAKVIAPD
jgi:hypothetical protein